MPKPAPAPEAPDDLLPADRPLYTVREASEALRVSRSTITRLIRFGRLRRVKVGYLTLIRRDDLAAFIASASSGHETERVRHG